MCGSQRTPLPSPACLPDAAGVEILVVEDSPTQAMILSDTLGKAGYSVTVAADGRQALEIAKAHQPTLVITDVMMPVMNGYELCRAIRADDSLASVPVVLLSGLSTPKDIIEGLAAGADHFVTKPYKPEMLLSRIEYILDNRHLRQEPAAGAGMEVYLAGQKYFLDSPRLQMLDMLLSTAETALCRTVELESTGEQLQTLQAKLETANESLESTVRHRTAALAVEIAQRVQVEAELRDRETRCRALFDYTIDAVFMLDPSTLKLVECNKAAATMFGYSRDELEVMAVEDLLLELDRPAVMDELSRLTWDKPLCGEALFRTKACEERTVRVSVQKLRIGGKDALYTICRDITDTKRAQEKELAAVEKLRTAMKGVVEALGVTVETRDPYTAGHQRRVADLALAIAGELGMEADTMEAIRVAGLIHDIGKISVPSEILAKPGRLSPSEFSLVREHAAAGHNILKGIDFPWPVAEIVHQHHERLDGTGYPLGLKGDAIRPEARVIAVADVVEAMASHRPYRPALGIDTAIAEIRRGSGTVYDPNAVSACATLLDKGYRIS